MKVRNISKLAAILPLIALGFAAPAQAHRIVHVEGSLYVIMCDNNGGNFTFNGSQQGAGDVAGMICPAAQTGNGPVVAQTNSFESTTPASQVAPGGPGTSQLPKQCPSPTIWSPAQQKCIGDLGPVNTTPRALPKRKN